MVKVVESLAARQGKFVLYQDRIGHVIVAALDPERPVRHIVLRVMDRKADETAAQLVGLKAVDHVYMGMGRYVRVPDLWSWPVVELEEPIAKPRDGKTYTWKYTGSTYSKIAENGWQKDYYPSCRACYAFKRTVNGRTLSYDNAHAPGLIFADCGVCHVDGKCDEKGVCAVESYG